MCETKSDQNLSNESLLALIFLTISSMYAVCCMLFAVKAGILAGKYFLCAKVSMITGRNIRACGWIPSKKQSRIARPHLNNSHLSSDMIILRFLFIMKLQFQ